MDGNTPAGARDRAVLFAPDRLAAYRTHLGHRRHVRFRFHLWGEIQVGLVDAVGPPFGDDALNFWVGARWALGGHAATVYDVPQEYQRLRATGIRIRMHPLE